MTKIYDVYDVLLFDGSEPSIPLFRGSKRACNAYVKQAIMKGQDPDLLVVVFFGYKP